MEDTGSFRQGLVYPQIIRFRGLKKLGGNVSRAVQCAVNMFHALWETGMGEN